jgi:tRNA nucleotidyltransferase (CCA-adding enzyme)
MAARMGRMILANDDGVNRWEHFRHGSDIGIRGIGSTKAQAFEQAALALIAAIVAPEAVRPKRKVAIHCDAADDEFLLLDWINAVIFEMATRNMLFCRFQVVLDDAAADAMVLDATAWGEPVDIARHCPAVEAKGATFTELAVKPVHDGWWIAQCVVDV